MTLRTRSERSALCVLIFVIVGAVLSSFFSAIEVSQRSAGLALDVAASKIWWADTFPQWISAISASVGALGTIVALYWVVQTFKETQGAVRAANDANSIASLDQRPWMDVEPPSVALTVKNGIVYAHVYAIARNVGRSAATGVVFTVEIVDGGRTQNMGEVRDRVFHGEHSFAPDDLAGASAFPNGTAGVSCIVHTPLDGEQYDSITLSAVYVFLCCTYRLQNGQLGKTGRVYVLTDEPASFEPLDRFQWQYVLRSMDHGYLALTQ